MTKPELIITNLLAGKSAVVSGAGRGIGRAIVEHFAANGADVCAISRTATDIDSLGNLVKTKYSVKFVGIAGDVSDARASEEVIGKVISYLNRVDVLVCAAGYPLVSDMWEKSLVEISEEDFLKVFNVDVLGSFRLIKGILPMMVRNKGGVVILFSSTPALAGYDKGAPYTIAKAANLGLVKEVAYEFGKDNIRAYAIAPGNISTPRTFEQLSEEQQAALAAEAPMKRWGNPDEVAEVAVALASEKMSFVTGQTIVVDGGTVML